MDLPPARLPARSDSAAARLPGLDLVRALAIGLVVMHHFRHLPGCPRAFEWFALRGYVGVDLFFVLSGWLIGGQLLRELHRDGRVQLLRFWSRRWLRTLPSYFAVLAVLLAAGRLHVREVPAMAAFLQNYLAPHRWLASWSLCIEEHFYLALPLLALGLTRLRSRRTAAACALGFVVLSPVLRAGAFDRMAAGTYDGFLDTFYVPTHLRLEGLALGVGLAALREWRHPLWSRLHERSGAWALAGLALVVGATWNPLATGWTGDPAERMHWFASVPGFAFVALGVALAMPAAAGLRAPACAPWVRTCGWISDHAYALYLVHELALDTASPVASRLGMPFFPALAATLAVAAAFAWLLRNAVERPGLRLRERLFTHDAARHRRTAEAVRNAT